MAGFIDINICLPVLKLSRALGMNANNTLEWDHDASKELFVVIKGSSSVDGHLNMHIVRRTETIESIDIAAYIDAAQAAAPPNSMGSKSFDQLPIFGITKESLLAIRYQLHGQARRVQLRMRSASDCREIVDVFVSRGLVFQEQQRPRTARPGTGGTLRTANAEARPLTANVISSPHFDSNVPKPSPFTVPTMATGSLSQHYAPRDSMSAHRTPQSFLQPEIITRNDSAVTGFPTSFTPAQPSRYNIAPRPLSRANNFGHYQNGNTSESNERPSSSVSVASVEAAQQTVEQHGASSAVNQNLALSNSPRPSSQCWSPGLAENRNHILQYSGTPADRPATAVSISSATAPMPDTLEHELPPRRELPFKRPESRQNEPTGDSSRPGSSMLRLPSAGKIIKGAEEPAHAPIRQNSACDVSSSRMSESAAKSGFPAVKQPQIMVPSARETPLHRQVPINDLISGRSAHAERPNNIHVSPSRLGSLTDAPHEVESPPSTQNPSALQSESAFQSPFRAASARNTATEPLATTTEFSMQDMLDRYAEQSDEDRRAVMDSFMVEMLQNPSFTTLCEDVENCWRRIALGL